MGNESAPVTIVEFGDYRCPVCEQFDNQVFPSVKEDFIDTGEAKFYFMNYAFLDSRLPGDTSQTAARTSECVYRQNETEFWDFHHAVYDNQGPEDEDWATVFQVRLRSSSTVSSLTAGATLRSLEQSRQSLQKTRTKFLVI